MDECENELLRHLETDNLAILTHVLTGDSVRQWVFYSQDIERTVERIQNAMASNNSWNLEATASADDEWEEYVTTLDSLNLDQQDT